MTIKLFNPDITDLEINAVAHTLKSGWLGLGPKVKEFENEFAKFIGTPYALGMNSCTSALELAVRLLSIGPGDEVIVPTITFVSTAHAVVKAGATPVFCDIDSDTGLMSLPDMYSKITPRTKALIPVHYGGRLVDIDELKTTNIKIIEDCAHACGTSTAGSKGDIGCFSFQAVKNLTTGDGGMITLSDKDMYEYGKKYRWCGINADTWAREAGKNQQYQWEYSVDEIGEKWHMNDIMATLGLIQLERLAQMNAQRQKIAEHYFRELSDIAEIKILSPQPSRDTTYSYHLFAIDCDQRDNLKTYLDSFSIGTGVHYKPIHLHPCYSSYATSSLPIAENLWHRLLSLPMHPRIYDAEMYCITDTIRNFYRVK